MLHISTNVTAGVEGNNCSEGQVSYRVSTAGDAVPKWHGVAGSRRILDPRPIRLRSDVMAELGYIS